MSNSLEGGCGAIAKPRARGDAVSTELAANAGTSIPGDCQYAEDEEALLSGKGDKDAKYK